MVRTQLRGSHVVAHRRGIGSRVWVKHFAKSLPHIRPGEGIKEPSVGWICRIVTVNHTIIESTLGVC